MLRHLTNDDIDQLLLLLLVLSYPIMSEQLSFEIEIEREMDEQIAR